MLDQFYELLKAMAVIVAFPLGIVFGSRYLAPLAVNIFRGWRMVWTRRK